MGSYFWMIVSFFWVWRFSLHKIHLSRLNDMLNFKRVVQAQFLPLFLINKLFILVFYTSATFDFVLLWFRVDRAVLDLSVLHLGNLCRLHTHRIIENLLSHSEPIKIFRFPLISLIFLLLHLNLLLLNYFFYLLVQHLS